MTCAHIWSAELKPETTCPRCGLTWADWSEEDDMSEKEWWVYVRNGARRAFPVGPFTTREQADAWVGPTSRYAEEHVDALAGFYEWGVAGLPRPTGRTGRFNDAVGVSA